MPVTVHLPGAFSEYSEGNSTIEIADQVVTLNDVLSALWRLSPAVRDRIVTEQGQIREHINIFIGDENVRYTGGLMSPVAPGSEITILRAVSGG